MNAWASTTQDTERARLAAVAKAIDGKPETLWKAIKDKAPYTRLTIWRRVTHFYEWALAKGYVQGANQYRIWKEENGRVFKHVYQVELPSMSYDEARARIETLKDPSIKRRALEMLGSGVRWMESCQDGDVVIGKGSKARRIYRPNVEGPAFTGNYQAFRRALQTIGLKPHMLRKLAATQLVRNGLNESDLCAIMGWSSFNTAKAYIAPLEEERRAEIMQTLQGGSKNGSRKVVGT